MDGVYLKRNWGDAVQNVSVLVAVGIKEDRYREMLRITEGSREDKESWSRFLRYLKERGLSGVQLIVSDSDSKFKSQVALTALQDDKTITEITGEFQEHTNRFCFP